MTPVNRSSLLVLLVFGLLCGGWIAFSTLSAPGLIKSVYYGKSHPVLNKIISGQAAHPLHEYMRAWGSISRRITFLLLSMGVVCLLLTRPRVQVLLTSRLSSRDSALSIPELTHMMGRRRLRLVYTVIAIILGGSLFDIATDTEHWPFSQYSMYSWAERDRSLTLLRLFGVTKDTSAEIPLLLYSYIQPFDQSRLRIALDKLYENPQRRHLLPQAILDCLLRYEALRQAKRHDGPALRAIRLYELSWLLDPWARNVDLPRDRQLLVEVMDPRRSDR